jgi:TetR/AcrR family tetracycline transcriptional repressor
MALTKEKIVDAALALMEREGLQGVSMRKLAQELDAGAATLYWHVGDKEQLLGLMLDRIVGESKSVEPDPENWQEQVKQLARNARELLKSHRGAAELSMGRVPVGPNSMPVLERYLAVLQAAALPAQVIAYAADMFSLYVGAFAFEESMPPVDSEQMGAYFRSLPADEYPILTSLADELVAGDPDARFEWALELLVRGLEALRDAA